MGRGRILAGRELAALDADERLARFVFERAGLDFSEGKAQPWTLSEESIETRIERSEEGRWRLLLAGHEAPAPLAVVYAAAVSGEFSWLGSGTFPRWKRRALLDAGLIEPPPVTLAALPEGISDETEALWAGIETLVRVRVLGGERADDPLPLSRRFLRGWTPLSERSTRTGMETLEVLELVWRVGSHTRSGGSRALILWSVALADSGGRSA